MHPDTLFTTVEAAEYLGISAAFLERDRWKGASISFHRIGTRTVRYRKTDLDEFIRNARSGPLELEAKGVS